MRQALISDSTSPNLPVSQPLNGFLQRAQRSPAPLVGRRGFMYNNPVNQEDL